MGATLSRERIPLTGTHKLIFLDSDGRSFERKITVVEEIGRGSSCICYAVNVDFGPASGSHRMIMKQFYPDPGQMELDICVSGADVIIHDLGQREDIQKLADLFEKSYDLQNHLADQETTGNVVVRPYEKAFSDKGKYILYAADYGQSLDKCNMESVEEILRVVYETASALSRLHTQRILHMDLKPENILWVDRKQVKFFDFDSSINMNELDNISKKDIRSDMAGLLTYPGLKDPDFDRNKKQILKPKVDIYALGSILFRYLLGRYPKESDYKHAEFEKELRKCFQEESRYRKVFNQAEQDRLCEILKRSVYLAAHNYYRCADEMASDLRALVVVLQDEKEEAENNYTKVNFRRLSAYVIYKYPLFQYAYTDLKGRRVLDVLITGDCAMSEAFLKNIFASAQMLDTIMNIRIVTANAAAYLDSLRIAYPLLEKTTSLFWNGKRVNTNDLDQTITQSPFANLYFYNLDFNSETMEEYLKLCSDSEACPSPRYFLLAELDFNKNYQTAKKLREILSEYPNQKFFIGYGDERGDGYDLRRLDEDCLDEKWNNWIISVPFGCNEQYSMDEKDFKHDIGRLALGVHTLYTKEQRERIKKRQIWNEFQSGGHYNMYSSIRSALSIPYKFASCGIGENWEQRGDDFYQLVLTGLEKSTEGEDKDKEKQRKAAEKLLNRMIYLEHRSWCCFMIFEGYTRPSLEELRKYAYTGKNNQRDKERKLHPLICDSSENQGLVLEHLEHESWIPDAEAIEAGKGKDYDELDKTSLLLHKICQDKCSEVNLDFKFEELEQELIREGILDDCQEALDWLKLVYVKMLQCESNINVVWNQACENFESHIVHAYNKRILEIFNLICNKMRVVAARNEFHDYKSSDVAILKGIPWLLMKPFRRIIKPLSNRMWENIISTLILEPEELVLVMDSQSDKELTEWKNEIALIRKFFIDKRGLSNLQIEIKTINDLSGYCKNISKKAVVDITGCSHEMQYCLDTNHELRKFPFIYYSDGKLRSLSANQEINYYNQNRHLTVEETFELYYARVESLENDMLALGKNYKNLWKAYISINSGDIWNTLVQFLNEQEKKNRWEIELEDPSKTNIVDRKTKFVNRRMLEDTGIRKVLDKLLEAGVIDGCCLPAMEGAVSIRTCHADVISKINQMIDLAWKHPYRHKFSLQIKVQNSIKEPQEKEASYHILDEVLDIDTVLEDKAVSNGERRCAKLATALNALFKEGLAKDGTPLIIDKFDRNIPLVEKLGNQKYRIRFRFVDKATKKCLLKNGNVLEAYTYHTIRQNALLDDVKINVQFVWNAIKEEGDEKEGIKNEIDLVCSKGVQTFFISCKQGKPEKDYLQEIKYFADYFGVDAKALIICSHEKTKDGTYVEQSSLLRRSDKMNVYFIDRSMIGDNQEDIDNGKLGRIIQNIVNNKKNWKDISVQKLEDSLCEK